MKFKLAAASFTPAPSEIDTTQHFWEAFDHLETEISAHFIVLLCQERGGWHPFSLADIQGLYGRYQRDGFTWNRLIRGGWVERNSAGDYVVTQEFVQACHKAAPAAQQPVRA